MYKAQLDNVLVSELEVSLSSPRWTKQIVREMAKTGNKVNHHDFMSFPSLPMPGVREYVKRTESLSHVYLYTCNHATCFNVSSSSRRNAGAVRQFRRTPREPSVELIITTMMIMLTCCILSLFPYLASTGFAFRAWYSA